MKVKLAIMMLTLMIVSGLMLISEQNTKKQHIYINEVRSWDVDTKRDGYYGSDYIELYNASNEEVSLHGWYISDDESDMKKYQIHDVQIMANDYVLLYANGKGNSGNSLNFKINPTGEKVFLSNSDGLLVDSIFVPKQELGTVYSRVNDGGKEWEVMEESILKSNNESHILPVRNLEPPLFSHESGFYEQSFVLKLTANPGETIYYTLDGSEPTKNSFLYSEELVVEDVSSQPNVINDVRNIRKDWKSYYPDKSLLDKATIVRAVVYGKGNSSSEVVTKIYFVDLEEYKERNILSIAANYDELFGDKGIFVTGKEYDELYLNEKYDESVIPNFFKSGRKWEIPANIQILQTGKEVVNQEIGLRIQGRSSREGKKKRLGIYAREEYSGEKYLKGLSMDGLEAHSFVTNQKNANAVLQELVKDRNVSTQSAMDVDIFLNGEYYYSGYLLEKYNKYYLQDNYGVNPENVMLVKEKEVTEGPEESRLIYDEMIYEIMESDFSNPTVYENLLDKIDIQSYIDYMAINAYVGNIDVTDTKNYLLWKTIEKENTKMGDTKWRWMLYDMDCISWINAEEHNVESIYQVNSFSETVEKSKFSLNNHPIFAKCKYNDDFCKKYVLTFMDLVNVNFSIENVKKVFEKWEITIEEYDGFFKYRSEYIVPYMAEELGVTGTLEEVTLKISDVKGGTIQLNTTTPDLSKGSWTGKYYTDYPVTVTAIPTEGYEFAGWTGSVSSKNNTIEAEISVGGIILEAAFKKVAN